MKEKHIYIPPLRSLYINPTMRCNLLCRHCWVSSSSDGAGRIMVDEMSIPEMISILEVAEGMGLDMVKITGGEPLLRDDLEPLFAFCADRNLRTWIETNGTLVNAETAKMFKRQMVKFVSVSLDSALEERHDFLRGEKGAFKRAVRGIELIRDECFPPQVIMSLYKENLYGFERFARLMRELGIKNVKINLISNIGKGSVLGESGELPTIREILDFSEEVDEINRSMGISIFIDLPMAFKGLCDIKLSNCGLCAVKNILGILPDGSVSLCGIGSLDEAIVFGNARSDPGILKDIWEDHPVLNGLRRDIPERLEGVCGMCVFRERCLGGCRAEVFYSGGKLGRSPSPFCQEAYEKGFFPSTRLIPEHLRA